MQARFLRLPQASSPTTHGCTNTKPSRNNSAPLCGSARSNRSLKTLAEPCHSEPVRPSVANGPERSEGAQGKLREESRFETKGNTRFLVALGSSE